MKSIFNPKYELASMLYPMINSMCTVKDNECIACKRKTSELAGEVYEWHIKYKTEDISKYFKGECPWDEPID